MKILNCYKQHECKALILFGKIGSEIRDDLQKELLAFSKMSSSHKVYLCLNGDDSYENCKSLCENLNNVPGLDTYYYSAHTNNIMFFHGNSSIDAITKIKSDEDIGKVFDEQIIRSKGKEYKPIIDILVANEPIYGLPGKNEGNIGLNQILQKLTSPIVVAVSHKSIIVKPFKTQYKDEIEHIFLGIPPVSKEFAVLGKALTGNEEARFEIIAKPVSSLGKKKGNV